jgi:uncharacterized membrane protein
MYSSDVQGFLPATSSPQNNCANIPSDFRVQFHSTGAPNGTRSSFQSRTSVSRESRISKRLIILAWTAIVAVAIAFVLKYVFHYYLHYDAVSFDPYWPRRGALLLHITCGMVALLTGPRQFFTGLRRKFMNLHRYTGRVFLAGVAAGVTGATYLAVTTTFGWAFGFGLLGLASAWTSTTGMAYYAIRKRLVEIHKRMDDPGLRGNFRFRHLPRLQRLRADVPFAASQRSVDNSCLGFLGGASVHRRTDTAGEKNA